MSASTLLLSLYRYKAWANDQLYEQLEKLTEAEHAAERQAALRIMNHTYVVDRIFAAHLGGEAHPYTATNTPETPALADLRRDAATSDGWYVDYVRALDAPTLAQTLEFTFTDGQAGRMSREEILAHVVTHGGYHRGAVGRILVGASIAPPRDTLTVHLHTAQPERRIRA